MIEMQPIIIEENLPIYLLFMNLIFKEIRVHIQASSLQQSDV